MDDANERARAGGSDGRGNFLPTCLDSIIRVDGVTWACQRANFSDQTSSRRIEKKCLSVPETTYIWSELRSEEQFAENVVTDAEAAGETKMDRTELRRG